jgi:hypothetical protein
MRSAKGSPVVGAIVRAVATDLEDVVRSSGAGVNSRAAGVPR